MSLPITYFLHVLKDMSVSVTRGGAVGKESSSLLKDNAIPVTPHLND